MDALGCTKDSAMMLLQHQRWDTPRTIGAFDCTKQQICFCKRMQHLQRMAAEARADAHCAVGVVARASFCACSFRLISSIALNKLVMVRAQLTLTASTCHAERAMNEDIEQLTSQAGVPPEQPAQVDANAGTCMVCMDDRAGAAPMLRMPCGHAFCTQCWVQHFVVGIEGYRAAQLRCMDDRCGKRCPPRRAVCCRAALLSVRRRSKQAHQDRIISWFVTSCLMPVTCMDQFSSSEVPHTCLHCAVQPPVPAAAAPCSLYTALLFMTTLLGLHVPWSHCVCMQRGAGAPASP